MNEFSETDQSIIKNMMLTKSVKHISRVVDSDAGSVAAFIRSVISGTDLITEQMKLDAKKPMKKAIAPKEKTVTQSQLAARKKRDEAQKLQEEIKKQKKQNLYDRLQQENEKKNKRRPPAYKTRHVDYSQLITVKIDRKTTIYANPGDNIEMVKRRFLKNYQNSLRFKSLENE